MQIPKCWNEAHWWLTEYTHTPNSKLYIVVTETIKAKKSQPFSLKFKLLKSDKKWKEQIFFDVQTLHLWTDKWNDDFDLSAVWFFFVCTEWICSVVLSFPISIQRMDLVCDCDRMVRGSTQYLFSNYVSRNIILVCRQRHYKHKHQHRTGYYFVSIITTCFKYETELSTPHFFIRCRSIDISGRI